MLERLILAFERAGSLLLGLLPYVLLGVLLAEVLKYTPWTRLVRKVTSGSPIPSIAVSSILGITSPLCTYGTVPIVIELYRSGVPLAPLLTFLSASSLMNPQLFLVTWGGLGREFALLRLVFTLVFSLMLGGLVSLVERRRKGSGKAAVNARFTRTESTEKRVRAFTVRSFARSFLKNLEFVGAYIVVGVVLSALLETFIPLDAVLQRTEGLQWVNVVSLAVLGIPLYACGGGTIPLVSTLMSNGVSAGAALAFLIVGPGTRITPLLALGSFVSKRMLAAYVVVLLGFSILVGMAINAFWIA